MMGVMFSTLVSLVKREGACDHRLLFGEVDGYTADEDTPLQQKYPLPTLNLAASTPHYAHFSAGKVLGYSRWHSNGYGTAVWNIYVVLTVPSGREMVTIPGISRDVELLLHTQGSHYCSKLLTLLKVLKEKGLHLPQVPVSYYRYIHARLNVGLPVREPEQAIYDTQLI